MKRFRSFDTIFAKGAAKVRPGIDEAEGEGNPPDQVMGEAEPRVAMRHRPCQIRAMRPRSPGILPVKPAAASGHPGIHGDPGWHLISGQAWCRFLSQGTGNLMLSGQTRVQPSCTPAAQGEEEGGCEQEQGAGGFRNHDNLASGAADVEDAHATLVVLEVELRSVERLQIAHAA